MASAEKAALMSSEVTKYEERKGQAAYEAFRPDLPHACIYGCLFITPERSIDLFFLSFVNVRMGFASLGIMGKGRQMHYGYKRLGY